MYRSIIRTLFILTALFCFWLLLSGHFTALFFGLGAAATIIVTLMQKRLKHVNSFEPITRHLKIRPLQIIGYFFWLIGQILLANIKIAMIVLSPFLKIAPHMVRIQATQKSLLGEVIFANSITLTPGTISVETQNSQILVHALTKTSGNINALNSMGQRVCAIEA